MWIAIGKSIPFYIVWYEEGGFFDAGSNPTVMDETFHQVIAGDGGGTIRPYLIGLVPHSFIGSFVSSISDQTNILYTVSSLKNPYRVSQGNRGNVNIDVEGFSDRIQNTNWIGPNMDIQLALRSGDNFIDNMVNNVYEYDVVTLTRQFDQSAPLLPSIFSDFARDILRLPSSPFSPSSSDYLGFLRSKTQSPFSSPSSSTGSRLLTPLVVPIEEELNETESQVDMDSLSSTPISSRLFQRRRPRPSPTLSEQQDQYISSPPERRKRFKSSTVLGMTPTDFTFQPPSMQQAPPPPPPQSVLQMQPPRLSFMPKKHKLAPPPPSILQMQPTLQIDTDVTNSSFYPRVAAASPPRQGLYPRVTSSPQQGLYPRVTSSTRTSTPISTDTLVATPPKEQDKGFLGKLMEQIAGPSPKPSESGPKPSSYLPVPHEHPIPSNNIIRRMIDDTVGVQTGPATQATPHTMFELTPASLQINLQVPSDLRLHITSQGLPLRTMARRRTRRRTKSKSRRTKSKKRKQSSKKKSVGKRH